MADELAEQLKRLSPEEQAEFRRLLKQGFAEEAPETVKPAWWQTPFVKAREVFPAPFEAMEWVGEHIEKPWAAGITAPFTPPTAEGAGKSWLEREIAEYEAWESPKFAKGLAEISTPVYWIPVGGAIAGGGKLMGRMGMRGAAAPVEALGRGVTRVEMLPGELVTKGVKKGIRAVKPTPELAYARPPGMRAAEVKPPTETISSKSSRVRGPYDPVTPGEIRLQALPPMRTLEEHLAATYPPDIVDNLMTTLAKAPGGRKTIQLIDQRAVADTDALTLALAASARRVESEAIAKGAVQPLAAMNPKRLFGYGDDMMVPEALLRMPNQSRAIGDVMRFPGHYNLNAAQRAYIEQGYKILDDIKLLAKEYGVPFKERTMKGGHYWPMTTEGRLVAVNQASGAMRPIAHEGELLAGEIARIEAGGSIINKPLEHVTQLEGMQAGVKYLPPTEQIESYAKQWLDRLGDYEVREYARAMARAAGEKVTTLERMGQIREITVAAGLEVSNLKYIRRAVLDAKAGKKLHESTLKAVSKRAQQIGEGTPAMKEMRGEIISTALRRANNIADKKKRAPILDPINRQLRNELRDAQEVLKPLRAEYKHARELAALPKAYETTIRSGVFAGDIYPVEIGNALNKVYGDRANAILANLEKVAAVPRMTMAGMDFGATQIHLLPLLFRAPERWAKAFAMQFRAFKNPESVSKYLTENAEVAAEMARQGTVLGGHSEFMQAAGLTARVARKVPVAGEPLAQVIGKFESSFTGALTVGQVETYKALRSMARTPEEIAQVNAYVRSITGTLDSRLLGLPAGQRAAEAALIAFAPRYTRSLFAAMRYTMRSGVTQKEALRTMGQLAAGSAALYYAICTMAGQEPKLDPTRGDFMTIRIKDTNVGLGSGYMAITRLMANVADAAASEPARFGKINPLDPDSWRDNPFAKFMRGRTSVLSGTSIDILTGRTYLGEPLDSVPDVLREEVVGNMLPFWAAGYITDDPRPGLAQLPVEMFGMRAWEKTYYERRNELFDKYAQEDYGMDFDQLIEERGELYRDMLIDAHPDLRKAVEKAEARTAEYGGVEEKTWFKYKEEMGKIDQRTSDELWKAHNAVDAGVMTAREFRFKTAEIYAESRAMRKVIEEDPQYKTVMEFFDSPVDKSDMYIGDIAFHEYAEAVFAKDLEDEYGVYQYDEAERRKQAILVKYGSDIYDYIQNRLSYGKDEPGMMKLLRKARDVLDPYWGVQSTVLRRYGISAEKFDEYKGAEGEARVRLLMESPQLIRAEKEIQLMRQAMRRDNYEIDRYYRLFYARS